ncbi:hypothetical protein [Prevotella jejuni]
MKQKLSFVSYLFFVWGTPLLTFCAYQYQLAVMDLDRTNRIFYQHVILNEKRAKDYQELDSLIHNNEFFKSYRTLDC